MKQILSFSLLLSIAFISCNDRGAAIKAFIPGKYAKFSDGELSKSWDTLHFILYDENTKTYLLERHVGFQKIRNGNLQPKKHALEKSVVVFHPTTFQLQNPSNGNLYTFFPEESIVIVKSAIYHKIE